MSEVSLFYPDGKSSGRTKVVKMPSLKLTYAIRLTDVDDTDVIDNDKDTDMFALVAGVDISKQELASITPTIGSQLFLYVGGRSCYTIKLSGLAFTDPCDDGPKKPGFEQLSEFYAKNNVKATGKYCKLVIGNMVYKGYLQQFKLNTSYKTDAFFAFDLIFWAIKE